MAKTLRHMGIVVSDMDKALDIYCNYLGCDLVIDNRDVSGSYVDRLVGLEDVRLRIAILRTEDDARVELLEYANRPGKKRTPVLANDVGASHVALGVADLQALYEKRTDYGVRFLSPPQESPDGGVKVAYAVLMEECIAELVEVLDPRAEISGGPWPKDSK